MKLRAQMVRRVLLAVALLLLAALVSVGIHDLLAMQNPVNSLPQFTVLYSDQPLPAENTALESYSWRFMFNHIQWRDPNTEMLRSLPAAYVQAATPLELDFSSNPADVKLSRADGSSNLFNEVDAQNLLTPQTPGEYLYQVEATFRFRGTVTYYFKLFVPE